jgi:hypothetical protein
MLDFESGEFFVEGLGFVWIRGGEIFSLAKVT